jgi:O-antigen/teichoic acid export membrane protein
MGNLRTVKQPSSKFLSNIVRLLSANAVNNLVALVVTLFAARILGPIEFGRLGLTVAIITLLPLVHDFGLNTALIKHHQKPLATIQIPVGTTFFTVLLVKILLAVTTLLVTLIAAPFISLNLFPTFVGNENLLEISVLSGGLLSLWITLRASEQAKQEYKAIEINTLYYALLRILSAVVLFSFIGVTIITTLLALYVLPLVIFMLIRPIIVYLRAPYALRPLNPTRDELHTLYSLWQYGKWIGISAFCFVALSRLPQFVLEQRANTAAVGTYSAALSFLAAFSLLNDAVRLVMLPRASGLSSIQERLHFRKQIRLFLPKYTLLMVVAVPSMSAAAIIFLGSAYSDSISVLFILSISTVTGMYLGIFNTLVHAHERPQYDALVNVCRLVALLALLLLVPPTPLWAAIALSITQVAGEIVLYALIQRIDVKTNEESK